MTTPFYTSLAAATGDIRVLEYITKGGFVGYILVGLSIAALGICIANAIQLRMATLAPPRVVEGLEQHLRQQDVDGATSFCTELANDCFLTRMFSTALIGCSRSPFGFLELRSALEEAGQRQVDRLTKLTDAVGLVAALGPMLGLLGTVFGMIGAFNTIGTLEGSARSSQLAVYMSHALVTTALGLVVAIPCTAAFTYFKRRLDRLAGEVGQISEELASYVQGKASAPAAKPVAGSIGPGRTGPGAQGPAAGRGPGVGAHAS